MSQLEAQVLIPNPVSELFTEYDLEAMPSEERYELIRGELCPMPNNSAEHGNKTMRISILTGYFIVANGLGECFAAETRFTIAQNPDTTLGPDFAFIHKERLSSIPPRGYLHLAPDLVIETRSPGDTKREFALKIAAWLQAGVQVVWALEPASQTLTVHRDGALPLRLRPEDTLTEEDLLPGFHLELKQVFYDVTAAETPPDA